MLTYLPPDPVLLISELAEQRRQEVAVKMEEIERLKEREAWLRGYPVFTIGSLVRRESLQSPDNAHGGIETPRASRIAIIISRNIINWTVIRSRSTLSPLRCPKSEALTDSKPLRVILCFSIYA